MYSNSFIADFVANYLRTIVKIKFYSYTDAIDFYTAADGQLKIINNITSEINN